MLRYLGWIPRARVVALLLGVFLGSWTLQAMAQATTPPQEEPPQPEPGAATQDAQPATEPSQPGTPATDNPSGTAPANTPTQPATTIAPAAALQPATPPPPGAPPPSLIPDGEAPKGPIPPAFPPAIPNIDFGARLRVGLRLQNPEDPKKMNDIGESIDADILGSGQVHRYLKWQASLTLSYAGTPGSPSAVNVQPLDVIARIEPLPELNVYMGRMLVVVDRFAPSGPWGMDEFFFPGFFPLIGAPALPKSGSLGRDVGVTVWGAPFGGHLKYYLGAFNLHDPTLNPLLSGRIQLSLLSGEPAFYHRTTYFGTKDLVSFGLGGQYQKQGSVQPVPTTTPPTVPLTDNYDNLTADLTVEKNIGDAGTLSVIGAYSKFDGDFQRWKDFWLASVGYMLPKPIGIGKLRATVRYQRGLDMADGADPSSLIDAQLSYNIAAWFARFQLGYRHGESYLAATATTAARVQQSNMAYLGVTLADP